MKEKPLGHLPFYLILSSATEDANLMKMGIYAQLRLCQERLNAVAC
jgi:hypothetical protein